LAAFSAGFCETAFFCVFAAVRTADFFADFFADFVTLFRFLTVFFAISRPVAVAGTLKTPGPRVETFGDFCRYWKSQTECSAPDI
jgi:hypothetical protein